MAHSGPCRVSGRKESNAQRHPAVPTYGGSLGCCFYLSRFAGVWLFRFNLVFIASSRTKPYTMRKVTEKLLPLVKKKKEQKKTFVTHPI